MTASEVLLLLVLFGGLVGLVIELPRFWAESHQSRYRYRLWALRDALVKDIADGLLPAQHPAVRTTLRNMEISIRYSPHQTVFRLLSYWLVMRHRIKEPASSNLPSPAGLTAQQSDSLERYHDEARELGIKHLSTASISGWVGLMPILFVHWALERVQAGKRDRDAKHVIPAFEERVSRVAFEELSAPRRSEPDEPLSVLAG